jgi:hypothetical protein
VGQTSHNPFSILNDRSLLNTISHFCSEAEADVLLKGERNKINILEVAGFITEKGDILATGTVDLFFLYYSTGHK